MRRPLSPSIPDIILTFLLAAVLIIPGPLGRLLEKTLGRLVRRRLEDK